MGGLAREGEVLAGRYRVIRPIGAGGMGVVYEVEHVQLGKRFAMKTVRPAGSRRRDVIERFHREARVAGTLGHAHLASVHDAGVLPNGWPFLVMELLDGAPLAVEIRREGRLPPERAVDIALQCCEALAAAHAGGVIHRDLKPDNVFLERGRARPDFVKLLDFGVSKLVEARAAVVDPLEQLTTQGALVGTPAYMAPEQLRGRTDIDDRADVYALGVVLFEMLAGSAPYAARSVGQLAVRVLKGPVVRLSERVPDVPTDLDQIVFQAMQLDRSRRIPTVSALADLLRAVADRLAGRSVGEDSTQVSDDPFAASPSETAAEDDPAPRERAGPRRQPQAGNAPLASLGYWWPIPIAVLIAALILLGAIAWKP